MGTFAVSKTRAFHRTRLIFKGKTAKFHIERVALFIKTFIFNVFKV